MMISTTSNKMADRKTGGEASRNVDEGVPESKDILKFLLAP